MAELDLFPEEGGGVSDGARVSVMLPLPLPGLLDYASDEALAPGDFVAVTVSGRETLGVVWEPQATEGTPPAKLKPVQRRLAHPPMQAAMRRFLERSARYTLSPPGMYLRLATRAPQLLEEAPRRIVLMLGEAMPEPMTDARRRVLATLKEAPPMSAAELARLAGVSPGVISGLRDTGALHATLVDADGIPPQLDPDLCRTELSAEQAGVTAALREAIQSGRFAPILLEGVTGSGKTETYLEAVAEVVRAGRQALILLPEIALTGDFIRRVRERFGAPPVEWHSRLTPAERRRAWRAVTSGAARVVAGARSALFLPFRDLALTVVDEEHDQSYKQEDQVRYHARDLAVLRAAEEGRCVLLASATPSLETWANAQSGRYAHLRLTERHGDAVLPFLGTIDLRADPPERGHWISPVLAQAVAETVARGEQALLFLNRRGYAPLTLCRNCGWRAGCSQCSAWMVEHRALGVLICHQCGERRPTPADCPECGEPGHLVACGPGVERIAEEAAERFPLARIVTLSSDISGDARALEDQLRRIARGEADILIGTQIVAKGHNFPNLTLCGIVDADLGLAGGDLRASERTFQLVNQVAGRAGRADKPGRALLQTVQPDHPVIRAILDGDGSKFRARLAEERKQARMPPFARLIAVIVQGEAEADVWEAARALASAGGMLAEAGVDLFGPAPAPFAMLHGKHRVRLLLRMRKALDHARLIPEWEAAVKLPRRVRVIFDVDPYSFL